MTTSDKLCADLSAALAEKDALATEAAALRDGGERLRSHADAMSIALSTICKMMLAREGGLKDEVMDIARDALAKHGAIVTYLEERGIRPAADPVVRIGSFLRERADMHRREGSPARASECHDLAEMLCPAPANPEEGPTE